MTPVVLSWSGGKDSAMALHALRASGEYEVVALLTTLSGDGTVSHHGFGEALLDAQADAIGLPLDKIHLPSFGTISAEAYAQLMTEVMLRWRGEGVRHVAFGDLFLEDLRRRRTDNLAKVQMEALFPLWTRDTAALAAQFLDLGFKAVIAAAEAKLGEGFAGRAYDRALLDELPASTDPCGEYGEFHTLVWDGPIFSKPIAICIGEAVRSGDVHTATISHRD